MKIDSLVVVVLASGLTKTASARKTIRRRADALEDLNLRLNELHLPGDTTNVSSSSSSSSAVVSCHRTISDEHGGWHGECDGGYEANFVQDDFNNGIYSSSVRTRSGGGEKLMTTFGTFRTGSQVCRVAPDANGLPKVQCINEMEFELEEEMDLEDRLDDDETHNRHLLDLNVTFAMSHVDTSHRRRLFDDSGSTIDVLVVWTPYAECFNSNLAKGCTLTAQTASNMLGLINLAVVETNVAFTLSNIRTKLRLVHAYRENSYEEPPEPGTWTAMLEHLTQVADGKLDSVHVQRALYGADVVHMIAGSPGSCGAAHVGPNKNRAFSVSRSSCSTGYYSFGHEIAHTLGAHHDRPSLNRCDSDKQAFNFGYRDPDAEFRTILAYGCQVNQCDHLPKDGCQRIQRFSNQVTTFNGKRLGDASNDNARTINDSSKIVAAFYPAMDCVADRECNDGTSSTVDSCNKEKRICVFTPRTTTTTTATTTTTPTTSEASFDAMETIVVQGVDEKAWKSVNMKRIYKKPVIACTVQYHKENMVPAVVRMTAVTSRTFKVLLQNPSYLSTDSRQVHCLVVEEGVWKLPDGRKLEAKRIMSSRTDSKAAWIGSPQTYRHAYTTDPVVLGQVMSYNDSKWSTFWTCGQDRLLAPDTNHFTVGMHVGEDPNRERKSEEIGFIVMERGRAIVSSGFVVESDRSKVQPMGYATGKWTCSFQAAFTQPPAATIATQGGMVGSDGSWIVLTSSATKTGFGLAADEDQIVDMERTHSAEQVNYVAVSSLAPIRLSKL